MHDINLRYKYDSTSAYIAPKQCIVGLLACTEVNKNDFSLTCVQCVSCNCQVSNNCSF